MIKRLLNNEEKSLVLNYIGNHYYECLYLYIDLTYYSLDNSDIKCWIQYDENKNITLAMLQYHSALHLYSEINNYDIDELVHHLNGISFSIICGKSEIIEKLSNSFPSFTPEYGFVARLYDIADIEDEVIETASIQDVREIAKMVYSDEDSGASYDLDDLIEQMEERIRNGFSRNCIIRKKGLIVANVSTGGETNLIATLNNVIVRKEYRRQGLAKRVYTNICCQLLNEGKEVYSIYYVPESIALHRKMGFVECCKYGKLFIRTH